jgi:hypothetical protein
MFIKGPDGAEETKCGGRANTYDGVAVHSNLKPHNHDPCPRTVDLFRLQGAIKDKAINSPQMAPRNLIAGELQKTPKAFMPL